MGEREELTMKKTIADIIFDFKHIDAISVNSPENKLLSSCTDYAGALAEKYNMPFEEINRLGELISEAYIAAAESGFREGFQTATNAIYGAMSQTY